MSNLTDAELVDESTAYKWAAQATRNCNGEPHRQQQCMDLIASALIEATAALEARVKALEEQLKCAEEAVSFWKKEYKLETAHSNHAEERIKELEATVRELRTVRADR